MNVLNFFVKRTIQSVHYTADKEYARTKCAEFYHFIMCFFRLNFSFLLKANQNKTNPLFMVKKTVCPFQNNPFILIQPHA